MRLLKHPWDIWRHFKKKKKLNLSVAPDSLDDLSSSFNIMIVSNYRLVVWRLLENVTLAWMQVWGMACAACWATFGLIQTLLVDSCIRPQCVTARSRRGTKITALTFSFWISIPSSLRLDLWALWINYLINSLLQTCTSQNKSQNASLR